MTRPAMDCFCGVHLEGDDEEQLLNWTKAHMEKVHPQMQLTEEQIHQMVVDGAYDARAKATEE
jgi:predicted small metal-binding protein